MAESVPTPRIRPLWPRFSAWVSLALLWASPVGAQTWDEILALVRRRFPEVRQLSTSDLADWLRDPHRAPPHLIDARSEREFAVSHLPGARHAERASDVARLPKVRPSDPVVVYCSVGYRSSALAEDLRRAGFTNVFNLEGSIFRWANEDRPVERDSRRVTEVHPFDAKWGRLLRPELHPAPARPR